MVKAEHYLSELMNCKLRRLFFCLDERGSRQIEMQASRLASLLAQKPDDTIESDLDLDELDATSAELKARD